MSFGDILIVDECDPWPGSCLPIFAMLAKIKEKTMQKVELKIPEDMPGIALPFTKQPGADDHYPPVTYATRRQRRRSHHSPAREAGFTNPTENNNRQANIKAAEVSAKAKRKATEKMKKAQRRRARA